MYLYLIFFYLSVVLHSPVFLNSSVYMIILKYYCGRQIDGWAGPTIYSVPLMNGPY